MCVCVCVSELFIIQSILQNVYVGFPNIYYQQGDII